ncbi:phage protein Gp36 family protein [Aquimarina algiphila]|uniref:phage protein Gp36 family protein n=1 Tax=Aquimarina algiphila TaxID=2047982 RepID=UPI00232C2768|nr:phage protein Gp36 family protein [Aquimarina algiphila]
MRFLNDNDYSALIRYEIIEILLQDDKYINLPEDEKEAYAEMKQSTAEDMAIAQIKNYLFGRYDTTAIFTPLPDQNSTDFRNAHIVMCTIDCTLYHLYSSLAPNKIPQHRSDRYQDVLNWLKDVYRGNAPADLPKKKDDKGTSNTGIKISSEYPNEDNRW